MTESWIVYDLQAKSEHFDNSYLEIHMENSLYPNSFLCDEDYFFKKLKTALKDAEKHGFKGLWTFSWLNDLPAWQKKMPPQWTKSIKRRAYDIEWHLGFWGQFLTAKQCFNFRRAQKFRELKRLPLAPSIAFAKLEDFKEFLS